MEEERKNIGPDFYSPYGMPEGAPRETSENSFGAETVNNPQPTGQQPIFQQPVRAEQPTPIGQPVNNYYQQPAQTPQAPDYVQFRQPVFKEKVKKEKKKMKQDTKYLLFSLGGGLMGSIIAIVVIIALMSFGVIGTGAVGVSTTTKSSSKIHTSAGVSALTEGTLTAADIIDNVGPAVVGINCESEQTDWFWGTQTQQSSGSGVIINQEGYIVTNNHVVNGANGVKVTLISGESYDAKIIGVDSRTDLAVIKIDPKVKLSYATFGDSSQLRVGDSVIAIGNPLGEEFAGSATKGIISATNRTVTIQNQTLTVLQTDAAINPGNSGGALVNMNGEVIGINTAKISDDSVEGLGFSIPSNEFTPIVNELIENGHVTGRPLIGITGRAITEDISKTYGYPVGVYVVEVAPFTGAEDAGIKSKDVILEVDGQKVTTVDDINKIRDKYKAGDTVKFKIYRKSDDKNLEVNVKLSEDKGDSK